MYEEEHKTGFPGRQYTAVYVSVARLLQLISLPAGEFAHCTHSVEA